MMIVLIRLYKSNVRKRPSTVNPGLNVWVKLLKCDNPYCEDVTLDCSGR